MVSHSRAPLGTRDLRRQLNTPVPVEVRVNAQGSPVAVRRSAWSRAREVVGLQDLWRIDDEWWRAHPISRLYHLLLLADDTLLLVYHDLVADSWFEQRS